MEQSKGFFFSLCSSLTICWHLHSALQKAFSPLQTDAHPSARAQEIDRLPGAIGPNRGPMMPSPGPGAGEEGTDDRLWNDGRPPPPLPLFRRGAGGGGRRNREVTAVGNAPPRAVWEIGMTCTQEGRIMQGWWVATA